MKSLGPLIHCRQQLYRHDYENWLVAALLPSKHQASFMSILALNVEISLIRGKIRQNSGLDGINQLSFWKDALKTLAGEKKGPIPRQPTIKALQKAVEITPTSLKLAENLVTARQQTLGDRPFKDVATLEENSKLLHSSIIQLLATELDNSHNEAVEQAANFMGTALGITTLLRATVPLLKEGVVMLPKDLMQIHGLTSDKVYTNRNPEALKALVKDLYQLADQNQKSARKLAVDIKDAQKPAFLAAGLKVDHALKCVTRANYSLFTHELQKHSPFAASILWWRYKWSGF
ncbi:unnamed protein product [Bursaphelenchus okinawaensis]|uniref:Uncharacterized protein n=1 Tax=Bursaphelenchus okinawaensis TaxID=465554 RepID=A0A811KAW0_9BILA|nr:unnamed protein product [Bursaphelenchus okinawaensis]CAG9098110.1 unnamed protein product [Bursaphelenchus okinawaensis]